MTLPENHDPASRGESAHERPVGRPVPERAGSDLQNRLHDRLRLSAGRMLSISELAGSMRTSRIAIYAAGMALHRRGLAWAMTSTGDGERVKTFAYRQPPNVCYTTK